LKRAHPVQGRLNPSKPNFDSIENVPCLGRLMKLGFHARCLVGRLERAMTKNVFSF
jgi:hypothetical protein